MHVTVSDTFIGIVVSKRIECGIGSVAVALGAGLIGLIACALTGRCFSLMIHQDVLVGVNNALQLITARKCKSHNSDECKQQTNA